MKTPAPNTNNLQKGFTLMEVLVVMAIILVLAGMIIGGTSWYKRKADVGKTEILIRSIENALEEYRSDFNAFPAATGDVASSGDLYEALYGDTDDDGDPEPENQVYLDVLDPGLQGSKSNVAERGGSYVIVDSWSNPLRYESPGVMNPDFDLYSFGPDGSGGPQGSSDEQKDDINNW